jgi:ATP-dependent DNA helicase RecG
LRHRWRFSQTAHDLIKPFIRERQQLHDLFFTERLEYPSFVWQEAIVNAVGHRDYSIQGASIQIWMFDDRIEVRSPGLPPPPATVEALNRGESLHVSRNPLIVRTLAMLGYMRELGEGIPRMFSVMENEGFSPPRFDDIGGAYFQVTLRNELVYDRETLEWLRRFDGIDLTGDQKRLMAYARARFPVHEYVIIRRGYDAPPLSCGHLCHPADSAMTKTESPRVTGIHC